MQFLLFSSKKAAVFFQSTNSNQNKHETKLSHFIQGQAARRLELLRINFQTFLLNGISKAVLNDAKNLAPGLE